MSPFFDQALVALLVMGALGYLARAIYKRRKGCVGGCCCPVPKRVSRNEER